MDYKYFWRLVFAIGFVNAILSKENSAFCVGAIASEFDENLHAGLKTGAGCALKGFFAGVSTKLHFSHIASLEFAGGHGFCGRWVTRRKVGRCKS